MALASSPVIKLNLATNPFTQSPQMPHSITFCLVIDHDDPNIDDNSEYLDITVQQLKEYVEEKGANFKIRYYSTSSEDRYNIERLPAINIYKNKDYKKTFYPSDDLMKEIDEYIKDILYELTDSDKYTYLIHTYLLLL